MQQKVNLDLETSQPPPCFLLCKEESDYFSPSYVCRLQEAKAFWARLQRTEKDVFSKESSNLRKENR